MELTQSYLREVFDFDGKNLTWNDKRNGAKLGSIAGTINNSGYRVIGINGNLYLAHRLIWFLHYGEWPKNHLDHINHDKLDNRIENLRDATCQQNMMNQVVRSDNTSGFKGISWHKQAKKWSAYINFMGKRKYLGLFDNIEDAKMIREQHEIMLFGDWAIKI